MENPDLDQLQDYLLSIAQDMLSKNGRFIPFGAVMEKDGNIVTVLSAPGVGSSFINGLIAGLKNRAASGHIKACGICFDSKVLLDGGESIMAICAQLEHADMEFRDVYLPHEKSWFGKLKYGELFSRPGERKVF